MGALAGNHRGSYGALQEYRPALEAQSGKFLTRKVALLILMVMLLLPFVYGRLFISYSTVLPVGHYLPQPSSLAFAPSTSLPVETSPAHRHEKPQEQGRRQPQQEEGKGEEEEEGEEKVPKNSLKQLVDHDHQEQQNVSNLRTMYQQQELVDVDDPSQLIDFSVGGCNIWKGKWIPHRSKPAYTNATCDFIQGHQNCLSNGRPDRQYLQWRWKPHDCELPLFDAKKFLKLVEHPRDVYRDDKDSFVHWLFPSYNFTLAVFWSPFLVQRTEDEVAKGFPSDTVKLYLDKVDKSWVSSISDYDYVVLSAGHWFMKSSMYFTNNELIGCHYCPGTNCTQLGFYYGLRAALRTVFDLLVSANYQGIVFFRTFTPDHFENGQWHEGGQCMRTMPVHNATVSGVIEEMYKIQLEEFGRTLQMYSDRREMFKIVDTFHASLVRADGHPGPYRSVGSSASDLPQDCLHWCLPGPIDTWSAMLLEMIVHM